MTRGQKGCYIYCTNKELSNYFKLAYKHQLSYTYDNLQSNLESQKIAADRKSTDPDTLQSKPHKL